MPYKSEKIKLQGMQDRRKKLTDEQKEEIRTIYSSGTCGTRPLAKQYNVSRSLIQVIVNPSIAEGKKQRIKEHWKDYRPEKEEWAETMKEHRHYKQSLYLQGKLKEEK